MKLSSTKGRTPIESRKSIAALGVAEAVIRDMPGRGHVKLAHQSIGSARCPLGFRDFLDISHNLYGVPEMRREVHPTGSDQVVGHDPSYTVSAVARQPDTSRWRDPRGRPWRKWSGLRNVSARRSSIGRVPSFGDGQDEPIRQARRSDASKKLLRAGRYGGDLHPLRVAATRRAQQSCAKASHLGNDWY